MLVSVPRRLKKTVTTVSLPSQQENRTTVVVQSKQRKRRRRKQRQVHVRRPLGGDLLQAYFDCLVDPFNNPPVRLGYGTMVPTQLHTAYLRTSINTSPSGNVTLICLPNPNNLVLATFANGMTELPLGGSANKFTAANAGLLNTMYDQVRTVAMGLRVYPMIPATSVPGIVAMGCAPRSDLTDFVAATVGTTPGNGFANLSTQSVSQMPYLREHMARPSAMDYFQTTWRPTDLKDFEFHQADEAVINYSSNTVSSPFYDPVADAASGATAAKTISDTQGSYLVFTSQGLPASTTLYFEVVLHMECIDATNPISTTDFSATKPSRDTVADENPTVPSVENLYRSFRNFLPNVDTVAGAATSMLASPMGQRASMALLSYVGVNASGYARRSGFQLLG